MGLLLLVACVKKAPQTPGDYYASSEYQNREVMGKSLFRSDQEVLSNEEIEAILGSRIRLPQRAHLAVLRIGTSNEALFWAFMAGADHPLRALGEIDRLVRVSWLPSLLVPEKLTVPLLREAAARFQADLLFIYRTPCQRFQSYRLFGSDKARTYCVAEGVLLDVRTGVVPFSGATTREVTTTESRDDLSFYESIQKSESAATAEALAELAGQLAAFLDSAPP